MVWPGVGAIVPVFNRPRAVLEALDSIAAQTRLPTKLIVVDDGSTDDTAVRIERWLAARRPAFEARLIRQRNGGAAAARNRGAAEAEGCELLAFLDSDDLWPTDYLARMGAALAAAPSAVAASSDLVVVDQRNRRQRHLPPMRRLRGRATDRIFLHGPSPPTATVVRAAAFRRVGGYEQRYRVFEDYYLCLRLSLHGPWLYVPGAPAVVRAFARSTLGGAPQLTETFGQPAFHRDQLRMLKRFIHADGGAAVLPGHMRRKRLAKAWYHLGRALLRAGRPLEAGRCFRNASRRDPWLLRAYRRRVSASLRLRWGALARRGGG